MPVKRASAQNTPSKAASCTNLIVNKHNDDGERFISASMLVSNKLSQPLQCL